MATEGLGPMRGAGHHTYVSMRTLHRVIISSEMYQQVLCWPVEMRSDSRHSGWRGRRCNTWKTKFTTARGRDGARDSLARVFIVGVFLAFCALLPVDIGAARWSLCLKCDAEATGAPASLKGGVAGT